MSVIKKETPEGRNAVEMQLVRLLSKHRNWVEVREISEALWRVGYIADKIEKEVKNNQNDGDCQEEVE